MNRKIKAICCYVENYSTNMLASLGSLKDNLLVSFKPRKGQPPELLCRLIELSLAIDANIYF